MAGLLKIWLLLSGSIPFNADEAIVALMARHILQGERPLFFYGQAYMGSLDAWLVAAGFMLFGAQVWVIRAVQVVLYVLIMASTAWLGSLVFRSWKAGVIAAWLLAIPTVNVTLYTTASLGGYGEALLIGNLILILGLLILRRSRDGEKPASLLWLLFGFLIGLGFWANGLTLVYSIPMILYLAIAVWQSRQKHTCLAGKGVLTLVISLALLGAVIGSAPWVLYVVREGLTSPIAELGGGAIAGVEGLSWAAQTRQHLVAFLLLGSTVIFGLRPPWGVEWLALPLLPFILFFWIAVLIYAFNPKTIRARGDDRSLLLWVMLTLVGAFVLTPFGADPSGRYFLPMSILLAITAGDTLLAFARRAGKWIWCLVVLLIAYNLIGTIQSAATMPPGITTQFNPITQVDQRALPALINFLDEHDERVGYTNYWVSYPLAFLSQEEMVFVPALPYHSDFRYTSRDNRYQPYDDRVAHADKVAFITTHNPALDEYLRTKFRRAGVSWNETKIGDFQVFYGLSKYVSPEEIGLGKTTP